MESEHKRLSKRAENSRNKEIRKFSKENSTDERQGLAQKLALERQKFRNRQRELRALLEITTKQKKETEIGLSETLTRIDSLGSEVNEKKKSWINKMLNFFKLKDLNEQLENQQKQKEKFEQELIEQEALMEEADEIIASDSGLRDARNKLHEFYQGESEKYNAYEEERTARNVGEIGKNHGVTFIHGIHPNFIPGINSYLRPNVDWETKLKILLCLSPVISTSTIRPGSTHHDMWARMGVILSDGQVKFASIGDAGTVAKSLKERENWGSASEIVEGDIEQAVTKEPNTGYNELVVSDCQIAGFYYCPEEINQNMLQTMPDRVPLEKIQPVLQKLGVPLFIVENGHVYKAESSEFNDEIASHRLKGEVSAQEISAYKLNITDEKKGQLMAEILEKSPFKLEKPEFSCLEARSVGRRDFVQIKLLSEPETLQGEDVIYNKEIGESGIIIPQGIPAKKQASFQIENSKHEYFLIDGKPYLRNTYYDAAGQKNIGVRPVERFEVSAGNNGFSFDQSKTIEENIASYIQASEKYLEKYAGELRKLEANEFQDEKSIRNINFYHEFVAKFAYGLYGLAEEAEKNGCGEIAEKALQIARKFVSEEQYNALIKKRIGKDGKLIITKEDLV